MENLTLLLGFLFPPAIDTINGMVNDTRARFWVSVVLCAVIGTIVSVVIHSGFPGVDVWAKEVMAMFGMAQFSYKAVYEDSKVQDRIRSVSSGMRE